MSRIDQCTKKLSKKVDFQSSSNSYSKISRHSGSQSKSSGQSILGEKAEMGKELRLNKVNSAFKAFDQSKAIDNELEYNSEIKVQPFAIGDDQESLS